MSEVLDISKHQVIMNFNKVKSNNVKYIMMRCAYSASKDRKFDKFYKDANKSGVPVGVYHFATWHYASKSRSYEQAKKNLVTQANKVIDILKQYNIQKYVALDFELESGQRLCANKEQLTELVKQYLDIIEKAGYNPILYGSIANLDYWLNLNKIDCPLWMAYYYKSGFNSKDFPSTKYGDMMRKYKDRIVMWQYSSKGDGKLYGAGSKYIDLNHYYSDIDNKYIKDQKPTPTPKPTPEPPRRSYIKYVVKKGDNLTKIATKYSVKLKDVIVSNPQIKNPNVIYASDIINIPVGKNLTNPYVEPTRILSKNYRGEDVKWVQWELVRLGYNIGKGVNNEPKGIDGRIGPITSQAIKDFQRAHKDANGKKLAVDGYVGPLTRGALKIS